MMETINDELLDNLLQESAHRHEAVSQINDSVMKVVSRESRKVKAKKMARLIAFCFGVPLLLLLPAGALLFAPEHKLSVTTIAIGLSLLLFYIPVIYNLNDIFRRPSL